jgi:transposase-like protein
MVRNYIRKTNRAEIPENVVAQALQDIKNGDGSIRDVAQRYGLKKSMLHKRLKKNNQLNLLNIQVPDLKFTSKYTTQQVFSNDEEESLLQSSKLQYGLTYFQIRTFAYEYASRLEKTIPTSWSEKKIAGDD